MAKTNRNKKWPFLTLMWGLVFFAFLALELWKSSTTGCKVNIKKKSPFTMLSMTSFFFPEFSHVTTHTCVNTGIYLGGCRVEEHHTVLKNVAMSLNICMR